MAALPLVLLLVAAVAGLRSVPTPESASTTPAPSIPRRFPRRISAPAAIPSAAARAILASAATAHGAPAPYYAFAVSAAQASRPIRSPSSTDGNPTAIRSRWRTCSIPRRPTPFPDSAEVHRALRLHLRRASAMAIGSTSRATCSRRLPAAAGIRAARRRGPGHVERRAVPVDQERGDAGDGERRPRRHRAAEVRAARRQAHRRARWPLSRVGHRRSRRRGALRRRPPRSRERPRPAEDRLVRSLPPDLSRRWLRADQRRHRAGHGRQSRRHRRPPDRAEPLFPDDDSGDAAVGRRGAAHRQARRRLRHPRRRARRARLFAALPRLLVRAGRPAAPARERRRHRRVAAARHRHASSGACRCSRERARLFFAVLLLPSLAWAVGETNGRIAGTVTEAATGAPVPGADVRVSGAALIGGARTTSPPTTTATTSSSSCRPASTTSRSAIAGVKPITPPRRRAPGRDRAARHRLVGASPPRPRPTIIVEERHMTRPDSTQTGHRHLRRHASQVATRPQLPGHRAAGGRRRRRQRRRQPADQGRQPDDNRYLVDGLDITDPVTNTFSANINFDSLGSVEVLTGGMEAQYNSLGGVINLITNGGSDSPRRRVALHQQRRVLRRQPVRRAALRRRAARSRRSPPPADAELPGQPQRRRARSSSTGSGSTSSLEYDYTERASPGRPAARRAASVAPLQRIPRRASSSPGRRTISTA